MSSLLGQSHSCLETFQQKKDLTFVQHGRLSLDAVRARQASMGNQTGPKAEQVRLEVEAAEEARRCCLVLQLKSVSDNVKTREQSSTQWRSKAFFLHTDFNQN